MNYGDFHPERYRPLPSAGACPAEDDYWDIRNHLPTDKSARILEVGCGCGSLVATLRTHSYSNVQGLDLSDDLIGYGRKQFGVNIRSGEWSTFLEESDDAYGAIIGLDVLEHLSADRHCDALRITRKRLTQNGCLILRAPNPVCPLVLPMFYGDSTHRAMAAPNLLRHMLQSAGFSGRILFAEVRPRTRWKRILFILAHRGLVAPALTCLYYHFYGRVPEVFTPNYYCFAYAT